jgi:hypothetical protein
LRARASCNPITAWFAATEDHHFQLIGKSGWSDAPDHADFIQQANLTEQCDLPDPTGFESEQLPAGVAPPTCLSSAGGLKLTVAGLCFAGKRNASIWAILEPLTARMQTPGATSVSARRAGYSRFLAVRVHSRWRGGPGHLSNR